MLALESSPARVCEAVNDDVKIAILGSAIVSSIAIAVTACALRWGPIAVVDGFAWGVLAILALGLAALIGVLILLAVYLAGSAALSSWRAVRRAFR